MEFMVNKYVILSFCFLAVTLAGCSREQEGTSMIFNKETSENFTTQPPDKQPQRKTATPLPGIAKIAGAPIRNATTKTVESHVSPKDTEPTKQSQESESSS
jgi:hypothetical protein